MMALMPRKTRQMYNIVTQLIKASFDQLNIDTSWDRHYFMCDFQVSLRQVGHKSSVETKVFLALMTLLPRPSWRRSLLSS
jgi:hypothetical protein